MIVSYIAGSHESNDSWSLYKIHNAGVNGVPQTNKLNGANANLEEISIHATMRKA